jgi:hypothetical protein
MTGSLRWTLLVAQLVSAVLLATSCDARNPGSPQASGAPAAAAPKAAASTEGAVQPTWTADALEELLAPIALYPDQLLGVMLAASVNSQEVLDGGNWLLQNQGLKGDALDAAAVKAGFGPAMRALFPFPTVIDMMCQQIDWTRQVGAAFSSDQAAVLQAVQSLRLAAANAGNLRSTPQQTVEQRTEANKVIVEVKPADPMVVYVPVYNAQTVYAPAAAAPAPAATSATADDDDTVSTDAAIAGGLLAFGVGVVLGNAMDDDDYCYPNWGMGAVYYGPRPFYPPAYVYRPVYGRGHHPAYHYASPRGYRNAYNNIDVNRNVVVNNDNYFNRFSNDQNLRDRTPHAGPRPAQADAWKGQKAYAGSRETPTATRTSAPNTPARADVARADAAQPARPAPRIDRGYGDSAPAMDGSRPARDTAFDRAGVDGAASFDRAASTRGRASSTGRGTRSARRG